MLPLPTNKPPSFFQKWGMGVEQGIRDRQASYGKAPINNISIKLKVFLTTKIFNLFIELYFYFFYYFDS